MAATRNDQINNISPENCNETCQCRRHRDVKETSIQTDTKIQGHGPRLSEVNLFTLLSLWMELFPTDHTDDTDKHVRRTGLVVVRGHKVVGLHCSGPELHVGQVAIVRHGDALADCHLYFSRRPCATCLKMIINAGTNQISFWPGDPEISVLACAGGGSSRSLPHSPLDYVTQEAALDAVVTERLKASARPLLCVLLQPLDLDMAQFVHQTSRGSDFVARVTDDEPGLDTEELFNWQWRRHLEEFSSAFLVRREQQHREVMTHMGLENLCAEPYFTSLRHNMSELVGVLAAVAAGVPLRHHGFYREAPSTVGPSPAPLAETSSAPSPGVSQEVARHCIIQARLLAYRTEDPKVGVGAVIWAEGQMAGCDGTGRLRLVGCGYNAYPSGSHYVEYPQMDNRQQDRQRRKYRYIVHAEQNALTFRCREIGADGPAMLFVTKCPCDECVPLIRGAGIAHVYTSDQDSGKDKADISYLRFRSLQGVSRFIWQKCPQNLSVASVNHSNGGVGKHISESNQERHGNKRFRPSQAQDSHVR